jgi:hypothetical protein
MTREAEKLRADNNLAALPPTERKMVETLLNCSQSDTRDYCRHLAEPKPRNVRMLETALDLEKSNRRREAVIAVITSALKKASRPVASAPAEVVSSEVLLSGPPANSLSPVETAALATVEATTLEARRLADLVKDYGRAGTAAKTLCGIHLRHIREFHFGPRNPNGGRPKMKTPNVSGFATWGEFLSDRVGITDDTGTNWMKMADAVEALAESKGLDLQSICQKLPWDWTPEETAAIDTTVRALTQDKTQRQLLQADFLSSLGYEEPERSNSSNNPAGNNGGKKKPAASIQESVRLKQEAARLILFGTVKPGFAERGSIALFMENFIKTEGAEVAALPKQELRDLYEHTIKDFVAAFRKLAEL